MTETLLQQFDATRLFGIASRLMSAETVNDAQAMAAHIRQAAAIATAALYRIADCEEPETGDRALRTPEDEAAITLTAAQYRQTMTAEAE